MIKYLKILLLVMAVIGLMGGSAFAGTVGMANGIANVPTAGALNNLPTEKFISTGYTPTANALGIYYHPGTGLIADDIVTFTFSNVAIKDAGFALCALCTGAVGNAVATPMSLANPTNGISTIQFRLTAPLLAAQNDAVYLADLGACNGAATVYGAGGANKIDPKFGQLTSGQVATVSVAATTSASLPIAAAGAAAINLYVVANQFSMATPAATTNTIDFASALKTITTGAGSNRTVSLGTTALALGNNADVTAGERIALAASDVVVLTISGGTLSGVEAICNAAACNNSTAAGNKFTLNVPASTAALNVDVSGGEGNAATPVTFKFDGVNALTTRTYSLSSTLNFSAANLLDRDFFSSQPYYSLNLAAVQFYVPLIKTGGGAETYIKIQSKNTSVGTNGISIQVLASDGSAVTVTPSPSSITAGTPWSITGTDLGALVPTGTPLGKSVIGTVGFAAIITINAPEADVFAYANTVDGAGQWKRIPMKVVGGTIRE